MTDVEKSRVEDKTDDVALSALKRGDYVDPAKLNPPARPAPAARALASGIYEAVYLEGTHI